MKANFTVHQNFCRTMAPVAVHPIGLGISAVVLFVVVGCATQTRAGVTHLGAARSSEPAGLEPGTIGLTTPREPAQFSFDKAKGKVESAGHGSGNAARAVLETPNRYPPQLEAGEGAVRFIVAPFAAAVGAINSAQKKLPQDELSKSEADLARAMAAMAEQLRLRDCILKAAREKTRRRLVAIESIHTVPSSRAPISTLLETTVEELRLERTGSSDRSFALRIEARARLIRVADGAVLLHRSFEYRSGKALFLDWTLGDGFKNVADTGYRQLAEQIVDQMLMPPSDAPVLLGAGFKKSPVQAPRHQLVAANKAPLPSEAQLVSFNYPVANSGGVGIYSTATVRHVAIQMPLTKDQAVSEAIRDVEESLDGLSTYPNTVVQLTAIAAALPISLWKQTAGAVRAVSRKKFRDADAQLSTAANQTRPHEEVAFQVAQQLALKTGQQVALVTTPRRSGGEPEVVPVSQPNYVTLVAQPRNQTVANYLANQGIDTALEIHVMSTALKGKDGINPRLALCVEAQAIVLQARDSQVLYSCPVQYRSAKREFTRWAAHDAQMFRQEMEQCSRELSGAIVDQLISRRLLAPDQAPYPTLATNSK